jgi:hypothetical protein
MLTGISSFYLSSNATVWYVLGILTVGFRCAALGNRTVGVRASKLNSRSPHVPLLTGGMTGLRPSAS